MKNHLKPALTLLFILPVSSSFAQTQTSKKETERIMVKDTIIRINRIDNTAKNIKDFNVYVKKNIKPLPHTHGSVYISFENEEDASIANIRVTKSLDKAADNEALRLVRAYHHKWIPDIIDGKPARAVITLPITFK
jgi:outer membrane biosynthesis protein TonB